MILSYPVHLVTAGSTYSALVMLAGTHVHSWMQDLIDSACPAGTASRTTSEHHNSINTSRNMHTSHYYAVIAETAPSDEFNLSHHTIGA